MCVLTRVCFCFLVVVIIWTSLLLSLSFFFHTAERDNLQPAMIALKEGGASASEALERERHGALVEEARQVEQSRKEKQDAADRAELLPAGGGGNNKKRTSIMERLKGGLDSEVVEQPSNHHQTKAARGAHDNMKDAMNAIHHRGAKINDLGKKTQDLEDGTAEYQNLAAQVRKKLEKQNQGLNFLNPFANR